MLADKSLIDVVLPNPKPYIFVGELDRQITIIQRHTRRPDFLPAAVADFLELKGRMLRVIVQQRELLVGPRADICRQGAVIIPEIRVRSMYRHTLEELCVAGFMIGQSAINTIVDASGLKIGFELRVDQLRMALVKPPVQFIQLLRRERVCGAFDFLNRIHGLSPVHCNPRSPTSRPRAATARRTRPGRPHLQWPRPRISAVRRLARYSVWRRGTTGRRVAELSAD